MKAHVSWGSVAGGLCVLLLAAGPQCDVNLGNRSGMGQAQYERTVTLQAPVGTSDTLDVLTRAGSITVTGAEVAECSIEARIVGRAPTEEEAQELAEQVEIRAEPVANVLKIRADKPDVRNNRSVAVSYTITMPRRMNVTCDSHFGSLDVSNVEGTVHGRSSNGSIKARSIQGPVDLKTSFGSVECRDVVGQTILRSSNGSITATGLAGSTDIETSYGSITCEDFRDGDLRLKSSNGRITLARATFGNCDVRSAYGAVTGNNLKGNSIELHSSNGSVQLTEAQSDQATLSSSYGSITAREIAVQDLRASSGNGSLNITCAPATPADLHAQVKTSYGSIKFTAPAAFSGQVDLSTNHGTIQTTLPITMSDEISKKKITGTVGAGTGSIRLETDNGSIRLKSLRDGLRPTLPYP